MKAYGVVAVKQHRRIPAKHPSELTMFTAVPIQTVQYFPLSLLGRKSVLMEIRKLKDHTLVKEEDGSACISNKPFLLAIQ